MNKHQKVTVQEVLEKLEENGAITIASLAQDFDVSKETIRSRIRKARVDGEAIIHDSNGLQLMSKEKLSDPVIAEAMAIFTNWILACFKGNVILANPIKPLLPTMKKALKDNMTKDERRQLAGSCSTVRALIDLVEIEEEVQ
jgi:lambda repressor-like predicted transcriptional regulator